MHPPGFSHHHGDRRERKHTGSSRVGVPPDTSMHVAGTTEHQRIQTVDFHAGEHLCAPLGTQ